MVTEGTGKKHTVKVPWLCLCHHNMVIFLPTKTKRRTPLSFLALLQNTNSHALGFRRCFFLAAPRSNTLPAVLSPAPNLASELHQPSLSRSYSQPDSMSFASSPTSFPKSYQTNWQKQLEALAQLPNTPVSLSLPSSFPYSKCSQQKLLSSSYATSIW